VKMTVVDYTLEGFLFAAFVLVGWPFYLIGLLVHESTGE